MPHVPRTCGVVTTQNTILFYVTFLSRPALQEVVLGVQKPSNIIIIIHLEQVPLCDIHPTTCFLLTITQHN